LCKAWYVARSSNTLLKIEADRTNAVLDLVKLVTVWFILVILIDLVRSVIKILWKVKKRNLHYKDFSVFKFRNVFTLNYSLKTLHNVITELTNANFEVRV
jgi:hypothetical protein